jgi:apolipoprotein N-acyltransferase
MFVKNLKQIIMDSNTKTNKRIKIIILLLIGLFFLYFSNGKYYFSLASWLFPIFILQISRNEKKIYSALIIPILAGIVSQFSFWYIFDNPKSVMFYIPFFMGFFTGLLFFIDRLMFPRIKGFMATLIFPLAYTAFDFLSNLYNPFGTTGILGYSQLEFLSFSQLASITGMWGITFMIAWFGSVASWFIDNYRNTKATKKGVLIYLSIFLSVLVYGSLRLAMPLENGAVKVSGMHVIKKSEFGDVIRTLHRKDTLGFKKKNDEILKELITKTTLEANAGSKIIMWSEGSFVILKNDEELLVSKLKETAKQNNIYLFATPVILNTNIGAKPENKTLLFSPSGNLVSTHYKFGGNFLEGTVEGNKIIKTNNTPYGNLSNIICWDADFPSTIKQIGKEKTDILFIPSSDWFEVSPIHTTPAVYRSIENGCSMVRQTQDGLSNMTDPRGKTITEMHHFNTTSWTMTGHVPTKRIWALYPIIGDLFGWLSFIGLLFFIIKPFIKKKEMDE